MAPSVIEAQITGTVFRDFDSDGIKDANEPLLTGVTVNAYLANSSSVCGTATTAGTSAPNYSLSGCGTAAVRVEFVIPSTATCVSSAYDYSSSGGSTYGSSVQFVNGNSTNINFAVQNPADYNTGTSGIQAFIPCYVNGDPTGGGGAGSAGTRDWFVGFPYGNTGSTAPSLKLDGTVIGSTWGVAYSKQAQKIFVSAFIKRHSGLGLLGSGGIYLLTPTTTSFSVTQFYDMDANGHRTRANDATAPTYGSASSYTLNGSPATTVTYLGANDALTGKAVGLGVIGSNVQRMLPTAPTTPNNDPAAFDQVGKVGLGDIEISDDGKYLFVMNLYSRKVFRLELNSATAPTSVVSVTSYDLPTVTVTNGVLRPFALKFARGKLLVGAVASGENETNINTNANLRAYVFELNDPTGSASFNNTPVLNIPLNYTRGHSYTGCFLNNPDMLIWHPWNNKSDALYCPGDGTLPTPILSDIEFTERGDMMIGFTDRSGHQWGWENYQNLSGTTTSWYQLGGDLLIAGKNCSTGNFTAESAGAFTSANGQTVTSSGGTANGEGPGGGEFFYEETFSTVHYETVEGSLAVLPGQGEVFLPIMDPLVINSAGTVRFSTTTGARVVGSEYQLLVGSTVGDGFGKAGALGDIEFSGSQAPLEIGNRVWNDANKNGIQDAGEAGMGNVTVELYPDFDNDGTPDIIPASSACVSNTTATGAAVNCGGSRVWSTPTNVSTVDGSAATAALSSTALTTHCLQVTGLGFSIPSNATITGVTATITRNASLASSAKDQTIQLIVGGTATGTNKADLVTTYPITFTAATYGSSSDLWGTTLSPAQVNATDFGINIRSQRTAGSPTARIDGVVVTICYTTPSGSFSIATTTTAATGDIGTWYFNTSNVTDGDPSVSGNQAGLAANKKYLVRIGSADWTGGIGAGDLVNYTLTTSNATPSAGLVDVSDNDAVLASTIPTIAYTTGSYGQNDHTLDFGFYACTQPSAITLTKTIPTCAGTTSSNNGKITLTAISNADKYGISTGATYTGVAYASATTIAVPNIVQTNIPNTGGTYTIRFFNGGDLCYKDSTVTIYPITCTSCPKSTLYLCGLEKPTDAPYFDHGMITYLTAIGYTVQPAQPVAGGLQDPNTLAILVNGSGTPLTVNDFDKIIVSHSTKNELAANTGSIVTALTNTSKPVLMMTRTGTDVMGMAGSIGFVNGIGDLWIENNATSILPSGLPNGNISVLNNPTLVSVDGFTKSLNYANSVGSGAIVGTYFVDQPSADTRIAYYGYPAGATLANGQAAAGRRFFIGFKIDGASASAYSPEIVVNDPTNFFTAYGKKLLDAAIENTCPCTCDTTLTVTNMTICNGSSVNLFSLASGVKGTLTYSTNGTTWTALTNPTNVTPSVTTTYYVKDTLTSGCFDIDTLVITVNPMPTTPTLSSPQNNICPATTVNLTALAATLTPSVSSGVFEWHVSNSSGSALVSTPTAVGLGTYYLFEKSPDNCYSLGKAVTVAIQVCCTSPNCLPVTVMRNN